MRFKFNRDSNGEYKLYDSYTCECVDAYSFDEVMPPKSVNNKSTLNVMFSKIVIKDGKYGIFSIHPEDPAITIPCEYDEILYDYWSVIEAGWLIKQGNKWGVYDIKGKQIIIPCEYDVIESAPSAWLMKKNGYWGVYDIKIRKVTLPCICDRIIITEHECKVLRGEEWHTLQR